MNNKTGSLTYLTGDATKPQGDGMKFILNSCNSLGFWGKGFVLSLSKRWKLPERAYLQWAARVKEQKDVLPLGAVQTVVVEDDIKVINIIGQNGIRSASNPKPVDYRALVDAFEKIAPEALRANAAVHCPRIGAGLGGGDWDHIEKLLRICFVDKGVNVFVYDLPDAKTQKSLF